MYVCVCLYISLFIFLNKRKFMHQGIYYGNISETLHY
jgi:hypothetical protein